jgi:hypothetical protein
MCINQCGRKKLRKFEARIRFQRKRKSNPGKNQGKRGNLQKLSRPKRIFLRTGNILRKDSKIRSQGDRQWHVVHHNQ